MTLVQHWQARRQLAETDAWGVLSDDERGRIMDAMERSMREEAKTAGAIVDELGMVFTRPQDDTPSVTVLVAHGHMKRAHGVRS